MKKIILVLALLVTTGAAAREPKVVISRLSVDRTGEKVTVSFRVNVARRLGGETRVFVLAPVLQDDRNKWSLPPVIIHRKDARPTKEEKKPRAMHLVEDDNANYSATIPFKQWMNGAKLVLEKVNAGWDDDMEVKYTTVIDPLALATPPADRDEPAASAGDELSRRLSHVQPASGQDRNARGMLFTGGASVYFRQGSSLIEPEREDNREVLAGLLSTIRAIEHSGNSRVTHLLVAGFASPEGSYQGNMLLSRQRATAVKEYIARHSGLPADAILVHDGGEDWEGLRAQVEQSRMSSRDAVLRVIDRVPVWDPASRVGRESVLKNLDGGIPYRYMLEYFFPGLRHAALVWIYYTNEI
ncbi:MAG: OmpA family protein [Odoribacteraceae bacterium]|nr:OmpA family protein [Odoribacteraceae bacterium]